MTILINFDKFKSIKFNFSSNFVPKVSYLSVGLVGYSLLGSSKSQRAACQKQPNEKIR